MTTPVIRFHLWLVFLYCAPMYLHLYLPLRTSMKGRMMENKKQVVRWGRVARTRDALLFMHGAMGWQTREKLLSVMALSDSGYASRILQACVDAGVLRRRRVEPVHDGANPRSEYRMTNAALAYVRGYGREMGVDGLVEAAVAHYRSQEDNAGNPRRGVYRD